MIGGQFGSSTTYSASGPAPVTTEGVLSRRLFAYGIDLVMIGALILVLGFAVFLIGFLTFGLGWALLAILVPATFILYNALTLSGPSQATIGMRMTGVYAADAHTGGPVPFLNAAGHALLFYLAVGSYMILWIVDVVIGLGRGDRRLGRDLLTSIVFLRRG